MRASRAPAGVALLASLLILGMHLVPGDGVSIVIARVVTCALVPVLVFLFGRRPPHAEAAIGISGLAVVTALIGATGGPIASALHPLVYLVVALAVTLFPLEAQLATGGVALAMELAHFAFWDAYGLELLLARVGLMVLFSSLFFVLFAAEARILRRKGEDEVLSTLLRIEEDAHDFRLIGASLGPESLTPREPEDVVRVRQVGSVRAIRESLLDVLEVGRLAVRADAAMLFLLNEAGTKLKLKECVTQEGEGAPIARSIFASEGAIGAVAKTGRVVNLLPKDPARGLGYRGEGAVGSFLGLPVLESGRLTGVLAVDRGEAAPFTERDEEILSAVAREAERAIESERIFAAMDLVKYEQERLYEAFTLLNEALAVDVFAERLLEAASRIKRLDFGAVTLFDEETSLHSLVGVRVGDEVTREALLGARFSSEEGGLVAMALKNGHRLPYVPLSEQPDRRPLRLFGELPHPELASVKIFPLSSRGRPLGALILGSSEADQELSREEERMVDLVCFHASATFANALMFAKMEMMATRDGLTGLVNRRRFQELLDEALARATRFNRKVSVFMVDADHFKSINDTYGHPVGDLVLQRIATLLSTQARRTDVAARYGGEEFVVILDETDAAGAALVAERAREKLESSVIEGDFGRVKVTASFGIACWPDHASSAEALLEHADQALYEAKRRGRNRVVTWPGAHCSPGERPAIRRGERASAPPRPGID